MHMQKISRFFKQILSWAAAILIAFVICDLACFLFYDPCQELVRSRGSTTGYLLPDSRGVYGLEGYCVANVDGYGYVNRDMPRAEDDYWVVAGASHTEGLFLPLDERYSDVLNDSLYNDGKLHMINIGKSGNYFSVVLQHLDGILGEFPDAKGIIIETDSLCYDTKALYDSMVQYGYNPDETAISLIGTMSEHSKLTVKAKQALPLLRLIHKQYYTYLESLEAGKESDILDPLFWQGEFKGDFEKGLDDLMAFIRSKTDKQIIILYHPAIKLEADGSMTFLTNNAEPFYQKVCADHDISFIDMSDTFMKAYKEDHIIPYGFSNTTPGDGHVNSEAHKMMADELEKVIR
jgi:lysophospholipase L1-like esterase